MKTLELVHSKAGPRDNLDDIARSIAQDLRKHGGGHYRVELAAGGVLDLEVLPDGGRSKGGIVKLCPDGTQSVTVKATWPNGETMHEICHPVHFRRILRRFLREASTPRPVATI